MRTLATLVLALSCLQVFAEPSELVATYDYEIAFFKLWGWKPGDRAYEYQRGKMEIRKYATYSEDGSFVCDMVYGEVEITDIDELTNIDKSITSSLLLTFFRPDSASASMDIYFNGKHSQVASHFPRKDYPDEFYISWADTNIGKYKNVAVHWRGKLVPVREIAP
mgnify:FL=1